MDFLGILTETASANNSPFMILLPVGLILILAKVMALVCHKLKMPSVIGFLIAGLLVGLITFIPGQTVLTEYTRGGIDILAKIGVVMIMFSAGLETNLKQVKAVGKAAVVITLLGVVVPMGLGFLVSYLFRTLGGVDTSFLPEGVNPIWSDLFYGVILSATSVSITVSTLKELGKLDTKVGSAIVSAAIIDDVIGIIALSLIISFSGTPSGGSDFNVLSWFLSVCGVNVGAELNVLITVISMIIFFSLSIVVGDLVRKLFNFMGERWPHHIRIPILAFGFCFIWAYLAQGMFQIADITGAYIAGLVLSSTNAEGYIDHRTETTANVLFVPVFFASVALTMYDAQFDFTDGMFIAFGLVWVLAGILGKILGCGGGAKMLGFSYRDSAKIGVGMMPRAEVLIVTAQTGAAACLVSAKIIPFALILILITSFVAPMLLKLLYKNEVNEEASLLKETVSPSEEKESEAPTQSDPGASDK